MIADSNLFPPKAKGHSSQKKKNPKTYIETQETEYPKQD